MGSLTGTYSWLSYHHDGVDQKGVFAVTVTDATGSVTTADIEMTDSQGTDLILDFELISTFATTIVSNGMDDVTLAFEVTSETDPVSTAFFLMNGFEMEKTTSRNAAHSPTPADGGSGGTSIYTDMAYDDGAWYHAAMVKSADTSALYVDGELVGSAVGDVAFGAVLDKIAMGVLKDDNLDRYLPGAIDEVHLYSRALSEGEIAWLAGRTAPFDKP